jgi:hypothetical protein
MATFTGSRRNLRALPGVPAPTGFFAVLALLWSDGRPTAGRASCSVIIVAFRESYERCLRNLSLPRVPVGSTTLPRIPCKRHCLRRRRLQRLSSHLNHRNSSNRSSSSRYNNNNNNLSQCIRFSKDIRFMTRSFRKSERLFNTCLITDVEWKRWSKR